MSSEIALLQKKGLTEEEAKMVYEWEERGRPGVARLQVDFLQSLYKLGFSCQEIHAQLPEYPLEAMLWARAKFNWDECRAKYQRELTARVVPNAMHSRLDGIQLLSEIMNATATAWRSQLLKYLSAPDREKAPAFLPQSIHQYGQLATLMKELMSDGEQPPGGGSSPGPSQIVSVNISGADPKTIEVKGTAAKEALKKKLGKDRKDG